MLTNKTSFLDPLVLARIATLQLRAKYVVEGFIAGLHQSPYRGHSLEFAQHREYSVGDELKHIDWKVYGRTDRFFVKQFEEETNLRVYILLDASASMKFKGKGGALSKFDYGATLAASLTFLTLRQQDSVGLNCFNQFKSRIIPPRNFFHHLYVILEELQCTEPRGETTLAASIESIALSCRKRSLIILISDLFDDTGRVLKALKFLRFKKHEVMVVHLLDRDEQDFPYSGTVRFDSLENGETVTLETDSYSGDYRNSIRDFIEEYRIALRNAGMQYYFSTTDCSPDRLMRSMLTRGQ